MKKSMQWYIPCFGMNLKRTFKIIKISSFFLALSICFGRAFTGAYAAVPGQLQGNVSGQDAAAEEAGAVVINLASSGQNAITKSGSFEVNDDQVLTLTIQSDIKGGAIDLFLFSPDNKEQRITLGGSDGIKTIHLSAGRWAYNCTGFFESGTITIIGTVPQCCDSANLPGLITSEAGDNNTSVINLGNGEQNSITRSGSFEAEDDQILILTIRSDIKGGTVAFSLFSPDNKEQRITLGGSDGIKTIHLSAGRWAYNCTGFFENGTITIIGEIK